MSLSHLNAIEVEALRRLNSGGVEFVVVGGHAVLHYTGLPHSNGESRTLGDLDLFVSVEAPNLDRLKVAMAGLGWVSDSANLDSLASGATVNIERYRVQFLPKVSGVSWERVWRDRVSVYSSAGNVWLIALGDLITNKKAAGRTKDLNDVEALEAIYAA